VASNVLIEIRHAAAAKASTGGNVDSNADAPKAPANTVKAPPSAARPTANENKPSSEPKPATAQEQLTRTWSKAQLDARRRFVQMHAKKKTSAA
jgi:hypothetical protein